MSIAFRLKFIYGPNTTFVYRHYPWFMRILFPSMPLFEFTVALQLFIFILNYTNKCGQTKKIHPISKWHETGLILHLFENHVKDVNSSVRLWVCQYSLYIIHACIFIESIWRNIYDTGSPDIENRHPCPIIKWKSRRYFVTIIINGEHWDSI